MKRPLGWIGLTYLSVLAVIFYAYSAALVIGVCVGAVALTVAGVFIRLWKRRSRAHRYTLAVSLSALAAVLSLFLYQNHIIQPILNDYSNKEIYVEGYVCDELNLSGKHPVCTIQSERINGEDRSVKITFTLTGYHDIEPFDCLTVTMKPKTSSIPYQFSRGVYLYATEEEHAHLTLTGEKHRSFYAAAVEIRRFCKHEFDEALRPEAAALSKAVLLGDKRALSYEVRDAFTVTGTSYLIVVSGMHLALVTLLFRKLLQRYVRKPWLTLLLLTALIVFFAAVTGFTPSVVRAGIMLFIVLLASAVHRDNDGFNSLGVAALLMCVPNPFIVGDVGLLLSFAATFGILLWADPIDGFLREKCGLSAEKRQPPKRTLRRRLRALPKRFLRWVIGMFSVSLAATLWVIPITILLFGTVSPLTVLISLFAYPMVSVVLLFAMLIAALFWITWLRWLLIPFTAVVNFLSAVIIKCILLCAKLPFAQLPANDLYCYIWLAVTALLVLAGYVFRPKRGYVACAVLLSSLTLTVGWALTALLI